MPKRHTKTPKLPHPLDVALGERIRQVRLSQKPVVTQPWLAREIKCTTQQVQKYETGETRVSFSRLCEISRALDMHVTDLIFPIAP